jgi:hypothetical protein
VQTVISRQWLNFSNGYGKRSLANTGVNGKVAPKAGTRRHATGLPGLASKAVVRVLQRDGSL